VGALAFLLALPSSVGAAPIQWTVASGGNGHWYELVTIPELPVDAAIKALGRPHPAGGASRSHLATITSAAENAFIAGSVTQGAVAWIAGRKPNPAGASWSWVQGPVAEQVVFFGAGAAGGAYQAWGGSEPNSREGENYAAIVGAGHWADAFNNQCELYVVEWSASDWPSPAAPTTEITGVNSLGGTATLTFYNAESAYISDVGAPPAHVNPVKPVPDGFSWFVDGPPGLQYFPAQSYTGTRWVASGTESFYFDLGGPTNSHGFFFFDCITNCLAGSGEDSIWQVTLRQGGLNGAIVGSFLYSPANDVWHFTGVLSSIPFDTLRADEIGGIGDDSVGIGGDILGCGGAGEGAPPVMCVENDCTSGGTTGNCPGGCDDGNPCTEDVCTAGACANSPLPVGTACDDGLDCTLGATCTALGHCGTPSHPACNDGSACTTDTCDPEAGCTYTPSGGACAPQGCLGPDINADSAYNVADAVCLLLVVNWHTAGAQGSRPACARGPAAVGNLNCQGGHTVSDLQLLVHLAVLGAYPQSLDADANLCVDTCEP
jgi:hypothetical protein